jgi:hypothetical protein
LELLAHLGEILRDLVPCFKNCWIDDFLEELRAPTQNDLKVHVVRVRPKMFRLTHDTACFRELVSLDESNNGFAFIFSIVKQNLTRFCVAFLRGQVL